MICKFTKKQAREIAYGTKKNPKNFVIASPLERDIEAKVVAYAKSLGCLCYKFTSPSRRSVPDRLFIGPNGQVWFIEFKRLGSQPTPAQEVEIGKIQDQKVHVWVADNVEQGKKFVDLMVRGTPITMADF